MEELQNLTFNDLPQAIWRIMQELKELREMIAVLQLPKPERRPIMIDEACKILIKFCRLCPQFVRISLDRKYSVFLNPIAGRRLNTPFFINPQKMEPS